VSFVYWSGCDQIGQSTRQKEFPISTQIHEDEFLKAEIHPDVVNMNQSGIDINNLSKTSNLNNYMCFVRFLLPDETYFTTYIRLNFSEKVMSQTTSPAPLYYQFAMNSPEGVAMRYTDCLLPNSEAALKAVSRYVLKSPNEPVSVIYLDEKTSFNTALNALNKKSDTDPICKGNN